MELRVLRAQRVGLAHELPEGVLCWAYNQSDERIGAVKRDGVRVHVLYRGAQVVLRADQWDAMYQEGIAHVRE